MKNTLILIIPCLALLVSACDISIGEVSFEKLEAQRATAIANSKLNAETYRDAYAPTLKIKSRGDSFISKDCPSGDGWATIDLLDPATESKKLQLKCSTASPTLACMPTSEFITRYTEDKCDKSLPFPLPTITKQTGM